MNFEMFGKVFYLLDRRERWQLVALTALTLVGAMLELLGIGLILPFISLLDNPETILESSFIDRVRGFAEPPSPRQILLWMGAGLIGIYWLKNLYLAANIIVTQKFISGIQVRLSYQLLKTYLYSSYTFHLQHNAAQLLRNVTTETAGLCNGCLVPLLQLITDLSVVTLVAIFLILREPVVSLVAVIVMGTAGLLFYRAFRGVMERAGKIRQSHQGKLYQQVNQALGGIKETKILGKEAFFLERFARHCIPIINAQKFQQSFGQFTRLYGETAAVTALMLGVAVSIVRGNAMDSILPALALFAVAAFRLLPSMNRILVALNRIRFNIHTLNLISNEFKNQEYAPATANENKDRDLVWNREIILDNISFQYPGACGIALKRVYIEIPWGTSVGLIGTSGAGKTTLVDVLLGLLTPTEGRILVDGVDIQNNIRSWQNQIGYIPQSIYLCDDTLRRNIALGVPDSEINEEAVWSAIRSAQLEQLVASLPEGLDTVVGERGVRLSGGQRQRIGIARALYPNPQLLVMDEATAALDNQTEASVMEAIANLSGEKTLIVIAHRLNTVRNCDRIYLLEAGRAIDSGTYEHLSQYSQKFQLMSGAIQ